MGFLFTDEAYATAMLAVVKAHQSRTRMQGKTLPKGSKSCLLPMGGLSSSSPGSFVIAMTPTWGRSLPQKPVEFVSVTVSQMVQLVSG